MSWTWLLTTIGCNEDLKNYLNTEDPDNNSVLGNQDSKTKDSDSPLIDDTNTPDDSNPPTFDCPDNTNFLTEYYADYDGDGYYKFYNQDITGFETEICAGQDGYLTTDIPIPDEELDYDDTDPLINIKYEWFEDADGDGYGNANSSRMDYEAPEGYVADDTDWDDSNADIHPGVTMYYDSDGDGFGDENVPATVYADPGSAYVLDNTDCDDTNLTVNPSGTEVCNGKDDDCDTAVDSLDSDITINDTETWLIDADGDGFADVNAYNSRTTASSIVTIQCDSPGSEWIALSTIDGVDVNNDGTFNADDFDADDTRTSIKPNNVWYVDVDGDGFGNEQGPTVMSNSAPAGYVAENTDWDDNNASIYPGVTMYLDQDGDGFGDNSTATTVLSNPGFGYVLTGGDWDDFDATMNPDTAFYVDVDGDGYGDLYATAEYFDSDPRSTGYTTDHTDFDDTDFTITPNTLFYIDTDGDGFGDAFDAGATFAYDPRAYGYVTNNSDNNDSNANVNPNAPEICDGLDNNQDGQIDEGATRTYYRDADGDGFGDANTTSEACVVPSGFVSATAQFDDDDSNSNVHPGATETCDGLDNDQNGLIDDGVTYRTYYTDNDGDGFGDDSTVVSICVAPAANQVLVGGDADDNDPNVKPDNVWYADVDGDGYGDANSQTTGNYEPPGFVADNTDIDDTNAAVYPGAPEICDRLDNDGDTLIDDNDPNVVSNSQSTFYADQDGDGFGNANNTIQACSMPSGYTTNNTDADDTRADVNPNATEVCDGVDNNQNSQIDEGTTTTYYQDADGDGYGNPNASTQACSTPTGYVSNSDDCDDADATVFPGAPDVFDFNVNDCSSTDTNEGPFVSSSLYTTVSGTSATTYLGTQVTNIGDLDADGLSDVAIGSTGHNTYGAVFLISGQTFNSNNLNVTSHSLAKIEGTVTNGQLAYSEPFDDTNGDATPDFFVYSPYLNSNTGSVYILSGASRGNMTPASALTSISGSATNQYVGFAVSESDVDGSGSSDAIVSQVGYNSLKGAVLLYLDPQPGSLNPTSANDTITGINNNDATGSDLASGDFDGDGNPDVLVAAYGFDGAAGTNSGKIYLIPNGSLNSAPINTISTLTIDGSLAQAEIGREIKFVPDMDGDGRAEILIGASRADLTSSGSQEGASYLFLSTTLGTSGSYTTSHADYTFVGINNNDQLGSLAVGDVNSDGNGDFAIGANEADIGGISRSGNLCIYNGSLILNNITSGSYPYNTDQLGISCFSGNSPIGLGYSSAILEDGTTITSAIYANSSAGEAYVIPYGQ